MADGTIKRKSLDPVVELTITNEDGTPYDLTDCIVKVLMYCTTTLATTVDNSTTTIPLNAEVLGIVEAGDLLLVGIDDNLNVERMSVSTAPTTLTDSKANCTVAARPYSIPAKAAVVYASDYIDGQGANIYVLSDDATFNIGYDGNSVQAVTVAASDTTTNYLMSQLVSDVQSAVNTAVTAGKIVVGNIGNQLTFTSATTGTSSQIKITSPNTEATNELGISAAEDYGEAAVTTTAAAHTVGDTVNIIKFRRDATIVSPATSGIIQYRWQDGDTDIIGTFYFEFQITTPQGRTFKVPMNSSDTFSIEIVPDAGYENIKESE